jgi:hypothetical protein
VPAVATLAPASLGFGLARFGHPTPHSCTPKTMTARAHCRPRPTIVGLQEFRRLRNYLGRHSPNNHRGPPNGSFGEKFGRSCGFVDKHAVFFPKATRFAILECERCRKTGRCSKECRTPPGDEAQFALRAAMTGCKTIESSGERHLPSRLDALPGTAER